jgi:thiamine biosynthesis lipoprotein
MRKSGLLIIAILLLGPCPSGSSTPSVSRRGTPFVSHYENVLGTSLEIKIVASSAAQSAQTESAVLAEIDREAHILSSWDPTSEFSRWFLTQRQATRVSPELFEVLDLFDQWRGLTQGALDASAEAISRVWKQAALENRLPSPAALDSAVRSVREVHWRLDSKHRTATHTSDVPLAMNSFVKSYIAGHAAEKALKISGAQAIVVNIGGDLVIRGDWSEPVNISDPLSDAENTAPVAQLLVRDRAVATSGDYRRGVEIGGRHYSHIVDPRTGMPAEQVVSSTIIARSPVEAGALATALSVLSPAEGLKLVAATPGAECFLIAKNGKRIASAGWSTYEVPVAARAVATHPVVSYQPISARAEGQTWDPKYELGITVELKFENGYRVKRPYLAVWIEDETHAPVRTISVWYSKVKFLRELFAWSRAENSRSVSEDNHIMNSVSSATRPPGKYTFTWDGRDDFGKLVKPGKYTVMIEASREHGTYQLIHQELEFNDLPKQLQLPGGSEIAAASLDYHK